MWAINLEQNLPVISSILDNLSFCFLFPWIPMKPMFKKNLKKWAFATFSLFWATVLRFGLGLGCAIIIYTSQSIVVWPAASHPIAAQLRSSPRTPAPPTPPLTCRGAGRGENHVASSCSSNTSHKLTTYRVGEEVRPLYVPLGLVGDLLSHLGYVLLGHHFPHSLLHL